MLLHQLTLERESNEDHCILRDIHSEKPRRTGGGSWGAAHNSLVQVEMSQVERSILGQPKTTFPRMLGFINSKEKRKSEKNNNHKKIL